MGRPAAKIDWVDAAKLAEAGCSGTEIAAVFRVEADTLYKLCKKQLNINWTDFFKQSYRTGNAWLKKAQYDKALKGNTQMLMWLGEQRLDQYQHQAINVTTTALDFDPKNCTLEQLKLLQKNPNVNVLNNNLLEHDENIIDNEII